MSRKLIALVGLVAVLSLATARVVREAPKADNSGFDFVQQAKDGFDMFEQLILKSMGVSNTEELGKKATETRNNVISQLDVWANNIKKETEALQENENVKTLRAAVDNLTKDFTQEHPKTAEDFKKVADAVKVGTDEVVNKLKTLGESQEAQQFKDLSQKLLTSTAETFQNLAKDLQESLKKE